MRRGLAAFLSGAVFGAGLAVAQMTDRNRILGFLDVAGPWDPTLAFVMAGALAVTLLGYRWVFAKGRPVMEDAFCLPGKKAVDAALVSGAALFGIGWGLSGYCPGPGISAMALGIWPPFVFIAALVAGSWAVAKSSDERRATSDGGRSK